MIPERTLLTAGLLTLLLVFLAPPISTTVLAGRLAGGWGLVVLIRDVPLMDVALFVPEVMLDVVSLRLAVLGSVLLDCFEILFDRTAVPLVGFSLTPLDCRYTRVCCKWYRTGRFILNAITYNFSWRRRWCFRCRLSLVCVEPITIFVGRRHTFTWTIEPNSPLETVFFFFFFKWPLKPKFECFIISVISPCESSGDVIGGRQSAHSVNGDSSHQMLGPDVKFREPICHIFTADFDFLIRFGLQHG